MAEANLLPITDRSYGIIPIRLLPSISTSSAKLKPDTTNTELLLINQKTLPRTGFPAETFWCFPKGHPEDLDESVQHTAIRELFEETGLRIDISDLIPLYSKNGEKIKLRERYMNPIRRQGKEVVYFVGLVRGEQELRLQEKEVAGARWVGWDEALEVVTFEEGREMLRGAREALGLGDGSSEVKDGVDGEDVGRGGES
ncbi:hypothetical protein EG329_011415 [Mollisiaceae sp. DMI_Dod_QoI]|nr:hypothetical protein EG329_011415 [Helotiales sp. DMI_Dod_QoI]